MRSLQEPPELAEWIRAVQAGDRECYAKVVAAFERPLWATLAGYCRSNEEADEFCHLSFVEAYFHLAQYDPQRGSFLGWLITIARSRLINEIHRRRSEGERSLRYLERAAAAEPPYEDVEKVRAALERCVEGLPSGEAEILQRFYVGGDTSDSIGGRIGKNAGAVRRALQRTRERLRACVESRLMAEGA